MAQLGSQPRYDERQAGSGLFYVPELTNSPVSLEISLALIETLNLETIEAFKAIPKRGLEIGGLLLGRFDAARSTLLIADREPVESEHLYGPSYSLSDTDWSAFQRTLARLRELPASDLGLVGFYRSHTRKDLHFDDQDNVIARDLFGGEPSVCLLVRPSIAEPGVAQIGIVTDGALQQVTRFPFNPGLLRDGDFRHVEAASEAPPTAAPAAVKHSPAAQPEMPKREVPPNVPVPDDSKRDESERDYIKRVAAMGPVRESQFEREPQRRFPLATVLVAASAMVLLCLLLTYRSRIFHADGAAHALAVAPVSPAGATGTHRPVAPAPFVPTQQRAPEQPAPDVRLILNVQRQDGSVILSWNQEAPTVREADHGLLTIEDGRNRQQLRIGKAELETGRVVYIPRGRDVNFRMQVFTGAGSTTASARSLANPSPAPRSHARLSAGIGTGKNSRPNARIVINPPDAAENAPAVKTAEIPARTEEPPKDSAPAAEPLVAPTTSPTPASEALAAPVPAGTNLQAAPEPAPVSSAQSHVVTTVSAELITNAGLKGIWSNLSSGRSDTLIPPRIVRQVLPEVSANLASQLGKERRMDVKITVGTRGEVTKAVLAVQRDGDPIGASVLSAARQWNFEPAEANGHPVEAKVVLHFVLKRTG
jgi:TonB family protein